MASTKAVEAGGAYVKLFTVDGQLHKGLTTAENRLRAFSKLSAKVGKALTGAFTAGAIATLGLAVNAAKAGDEVHKMNLRTGVATETLSRLAFAGEQAGTELGSLEKGIKGMQRNILAASRGVKTVTDTFDDLGISVEDISAMSPEEQFLTFAEAIKNVADPTLRAGLAMQIFGRSGQEMLPLLTEGREGIKKLTDEADRLGRTISQDEANLAAEFTDELNRLKSEAASLARELGSDLIPIFLDLFQSARENIPAIKEFVEQVVQTAIQNKRLIGILAIVGPSLMSLGAAANLAASGFGLLKLAMAGTTNSGKALRALGIVSILTAIGVAAVKSTQAFKDLNDEIMKSKGLDSELIRIEEARTKKIVEQANSMQGDEKKNFIADEIAKLDVSIKSLQNAENSARKRLDSATSGLAGGARDALGVNPLAKEARAEIDSFATLRRSASNRRASLEQLSVTSSDSATTQATSSGKSGTSLAGNAGGIAKAFIGAWSPVISDAAAKAKELQDAEIKRRTVQGGVGVLRQFSPALNTGLGIAEVLQGAVSASAAKAPEAVSQVSQRISENRAVESGTAEAQRLIAQALAPRASVEQKALTAAEKTAGNSEELKSIIGALASFVAR